MTNNLPEKVPENEVLALSDKDSEQFLSLKVKGQLFGIPVLKIRDVLKPQNITKVPLSRKEILGYMNLRGRIVTVIDVRERLGLESEEGEETPDQMFVVVEQEEDLYCLVVDSVAETKTLSISDFEKNPENLDESWRDVSRGIFKLKKELMLVLHIDKLLKIEEEEEA